jgi:hypothetical protein
MSRGFTQNQGQTQGDNNQPKRKQRLNVPATMLMLQEAPVGIDDTVELDGEQVTDVVVVGRVVGIDHQAMRTVFDINDNTACNKVIFYKKGTDEVPTSLKGFVERENIYVKIHGTVRVFKEERAIVGIRIQEVTDHNEITNHLLQVCVAHQARVKGTLSTDQLKNPAHLGGGQMVKVAKNQSNEEASQIVFDLMQEVIKKQGAKFCHKKDLWTCCQNQMSQQDFNAALQTLAEDGAIYSTIDDDQFGITD